MNHYSSTRDTYLESGSISSIIIAKTLDVSIKSLFNDPGDVEGFVLLKGKSYHFNSREELSFKERQAKPSCMVSLH